MLSGIFIRPLLVKKPLLGPLRQVGTTLQGEAAVDYLKEQGIYQQLRASIEATNYELTRAPQTGNSPTSTTKHSPEVYLASNPAQKLSAQFSAEEVRLESSQGEAKEAVLKLRGYGYGKNMLALSAGSTRVAGSRVEISRTVEEAPSSELNRKEPTGANQGSVTEWYLNNKDGIEQGFTLQGPPANRSAKLPLRLSMKVSGKVKVVAADSGGAVELRSENGQPWLRYHHLVATDARGHELPAKIEVLGREISLVVNDADAIYPVQIDPTFTQAAELSASDGAAGDQFGFSVGISGDTVVVGAQRAAAGANTQTGAAYIFERNQGGADTWGQVKKLIASDGVQGDSFGAVGIDGDTVVVGAGGKNTSTGAAYIFERNQGGAENWGQVKKLTASDGAGSDFFGNGGAVGISGDTVVVGAFGHNSLTGAAYIFERNQGGAENWGQVKELAPIDNAQDNFGFSVGISIDTIVIGARDANSQKGAAYIFERNQGGVESWGQVQELTASDAAQDDSFGSAARINGDTVVVGA